LKSLFDSNTDKESVEKWKNVDSDTISSINPKDDGDFIKTQQTPGKIGGLSVVLFEYKQERACPQTHGDGFMVSIRRILISQNYEIQFHIVNFWQSC
jgi:hypothetical protein